jgi:hypothetical protein
MYTIFKEVGKAYLHIFCTGCNMYIDNSDPPLVLHCKPTRIAGAIEMVHHPHQLPLLWQGVAFSIWGAPPPLIPVVVTDRHTSILKKFSRTTSPRLE